MKTVSLAQLKRIVKEEVTLEASKKRPSPGLMTVSRLIAQLKKMPPDLPVLVGDHDGYWYDARRVSTKCIEEGDEIDGEPNAVCVGSM